MAVNDEAPLNNTDPINGETVVMPDNRFAVLPPGTYTVPTLPPSFGGVEYQVLWSDMINSSGAVRGGWTTFVDDANATGLDWRVRLVIGPAKASEILAQTNVGGAGVVGGTTPDVLEPLFLSEVERCTALLAVKLKASARFKAWVMVGPDNGDGRMLADGVGDDLLMRVNAIERTIAATAATFTAKNVVFTVEPFTAGETVSGAALGRVWVKAAGLFSTRLNPEVRLTGDGSDRYVVSRAARHAWGRWVARTDQTGTALAADINRAAAHGAHSLNTTRYTDTAAINSTGAQVFPAVGVFDDTLRKRNMAGLADRNSRPTGGYGRHVGGPISAYMSDRALSDVLLDIVTTGHGEDHLDVAPGAQPSTGNTDAVSVLIPAGHTVQARSDSTGPLGDRCLRFESAVNVSANARLEHALPSDVSKVRSQAVMRFNVEPTGQVQLLGVQGSAGRAAGVAVTGTRQLRLLSFGNGNAFTSPAGIVPVGVPFLLGFDVDIAAAGGAARFRIWTDPAAAETQTPVYDSGWIGGLATDAGDTNKTMRYGLIGGPVGNFSLDVWNVWWSTAAEIEGFGRLTDPVLPLVATDIGGGGGGGVFTFDPTAFIAGVWFGDGYTKPMAGTLNGQPVNVFDIGFEKSDAAFYGHFEDAIALTPGLTMSPRTESNDGSRWNYRVKVHNDGPFANWDPTEGHAQYSPISGGGRPTNITAAPDGLISTVSGWLSWMMGGIYGEGSQGGIVFDESHPENNVERQQAAKVAVEAAGLTALLSTEQVNDRIIKVPPAEYPILQALPFRSFNRVPGGPPSGPAPDPGPGVDTSGLLTELDQAEADGYEVGLRLYWGGWFKGNDPVVAYTSQLRKLCGTMQYNSSDPGLGSYVEADDRRLICRPWVDIVSRVCEGVNFGLAASLDGHPALRSVQMFGAQCKRYAEHDIWGDTFNDGPGPTNVVAALAAGVTQQLETTSHGLEIFAAVTAWPTTNIYRPGGLSGTPWVNGKDNNLTKDRTATLCFVGNKHAEIGTNGYRDSMARQGTSEQEIIGDIQARRDQGFWYRHQTIHAGSIQEDGYTITAILDRAVVDRVKLLELPDGYDTGGAHVLVSPAQAASYDSQLRGETLVGLAATVKGSGTAQGSMRVRRRLRSTVSGVAVASGAVKARRKLAGSGVGVAVVSGQLETVGVTQLSGFVSGEAVVVATMGVRRDMGRTVTVLATGTASGTVHARRRLTAPAAVGAGSVTGTARASRKMTAETVSQATATGLLSIPTGATVTMAGAATGTATILRAAMGISYDSQPGDNLQVSFGQPSFGGDDVNLSTVDDGFLLYDLTFWSTADTSDRLTVPVRFVNRPDTASVRWGLSVGLDPLPSSWWTGDASNLAAWTGSARTVTIDTPTIGVNAAMAMAVGDNRVLWCEIAQGDERIIKPVTRLHLR